MWWNHFHVAAIAVRHATPVLTVITNALGTQNITTVRAVIANVLITLNPAPHIHAIQAAAPQHVHPHRHVVKVALMTVQLHMVTKKFLVGRVVQVVSVPILQQRASRGNAARHAPTTTIAPARVTARNWDPPEHAILPQHMQHAHAPIPPLPPNVLRINAERGAGVILIAAGIMACIARMLIQKKLELIIATHHRHAHATLIRHH
jgi:hypothetical protein